MVFAVEGSRLDEVVTINIPFDYLHSVVCQIDGEIVPRHQWRSTLLREGQHVLIYVVPHGGGSGKSMIGLIAALAVAVVAPMIGGAIAAGLGMAAGSIGASLVTAGVALVGALAIRALFPPPKPPKSQKQDVTQSQSYSFTGGRNTYNPFGPIPRIYGKHKFVPPYAATPYIESRGYDQRMYMLFHFGYGKVDLSDMRIGENPLTAFKDIEVVIHQNFKAGDKLTWFTRDQAQDSYSQVLEHDGWRTVTTVEGAEQAVIDWQFPQGLAKVQPEGDVDAVAVEIEVLFRKVGTTNWYAYQSIPYGFWGPTSGSRDGGFDLQGNGMGAVFNDGVIVGGNQAWSTEGLQYEIKAVDAAHYTKVTTLGAPVVGAHRSKIVGTFNKQVRHSSGVGNDKEVWYTTEAWQRIQDYLGVSFTYSGIPNQYTKLTVINGVLKPFFVSLQLTFPEAAQWEIQTRRTSVDTDALDIQDTVVLAALRSSINRPPVAPRKPVTIVEMRALATDQLNGIVDTFSAIAEGYVRVWTGSSWVEQKTSIPAWCYADAIQGHVGGVYLPDSRLDIAYMQYWASRTQADTPAAPGIPRCQCDLIVDFDTTLWELLKLIASTGDASPTVRDSKFSVTIDELPTTPVQMLTPRNSWNLEATKNFITVPHALKVTFVDPDSHWERRERIVYADGYSADGTVPDTQVATIFETLDLMGIKRPEQAYRIGRKSLAQGILRPEDFTVDMDIENLVATRGDYILVAHDVPKIGAGWGYVKFWEPATGHLRLDNNFTIAFNAGSFYVRIRKVDGRMLDYPILSWYDYDIAVIDGDAEVAVEDLLSYGELETITGDYRLKSIATHPDLTATLELEELAPGVYTSDSDPIPPYVPIIAPEYAPGTPPVPGPVISLSAMITRTIVNRYPYASVVLSWAPPINTPVIEYEIYKLSPDEVTWVLMGTTKDRFFTLYDNINLVNPDGSPAIFVNVTQVIAVVAIGKYGRVEFLDAAQIAVYIEQDREPPEPAPWLHVNLAKDMIHIEWASSPSNDVEYYELWYEPSNIYNVYDFVRSSMLVDKISWDQNAIQVPARIGAYFLRTVDTSRNRSEETAAIFTTIPGIDGYDELLNYTEPTTWPGIKDNVEVVGDKLVLKKLADDLDEDGNVIGSLYAPEGRYYVSVRAELDEVAIVRISQYLSNTSLNSRNTMHYWGMMSTVYTLTSPHGEIQAPGNDGNAEVWIRRGEDGWDMHEWVPLHAAIPLNLNAAIYDDWRKFIAGEFTGSIFDFMLILRAPIPNVTPVVGGFQYTIDVPERTIRLDNVAAAMGVAVNVVFDPPFYKAPAVGITIQSLTAADTFTQSPTTKDGFSITMTNRAAVLDIVATGWGRSGMSINALNDNRSNRQLSRRA